jgi:histidinol-phosphate/aromatic aminotransferase/cobyric acid decarboxylase-like protein
VLATAGSTAAVAELARTLPPGARVAVEEPGYQRAVAALRAAGLTVVPAPVDRAGLVVEALPDRLAAVYCTPAHQFPLGGRLSASRRVALVDRARAEGFLVIEDDYDGEMRYDVAPLPLLAALGRDVVVHLGTCSKLLTPTLGAGWVVAPPAVRDALLDVRDRTGTRPPPAGQRVFAALAAHGDLARHLRRLRRELGRRRGLVAVAVVAAGCRPDGDVAGAHLVVALPDRAAEHAALSRAAERGVALDGLARFHGHPACGTASCSATPARPAASSTAPCRWSATCSPGSASRADRSGTALAVLPRSPDRLRRPRQGPERTRPDQHRRAATRRVQRAQCPVSVRTCSASRRATTVSMVASSRANRCHASCASGDGGATGVTIPKKQTRQTRVNRSGQGKKRDQALTSSYGAEHG